MDAVMANDNLTQQTGQSEILESYAAIKRAADDRLAAIDHTIEQLETEKDQLRAVFFPNMTAGGTPRVSRRGRTTKVPTARLVQAIRELGTFTVDELVQKTGYAHRQAAVQALMLQQRAGVVSRIDGGHGVVATYKATETH